MALVILTLINTQPQRQKQGIPMETRTEVHSLVKRMLGNEFIARDEDRVLSWVEGRLDILPVNTRYPFEQVTLKGQDRRAG